ncbi:hypothetical protein [Sphaerotilus sp.]|uniref:hypothetical protein n=1 Tax=Sphaerotilus sp. TaxID=2093942 RepID=UPI002ACE2397|nr:hypothetical protein [Sphaerotilus sp.]MDZ7854801.1 hypothetical protein [Sphaerotilus sp.]
MKRSFLLTICRMLIGVVLFAQFAVAAYACPGLSVAGTPKPGMVIPVVAEVQSMGTDRVSITLAAMDCDDMAGSMDPSSANLCAEHCRQGHQSDQAATLTLPAALLTALYRLPLAPEPPALSPRQAAEEVSALAAASPPHAILHCCFRT